MSKQKLYVVMIYEGYIRDAQMIDFERVPQDIAPYEDAVDYANDPKNSDCWVDCYGGVFVDIVRATSDEDAIDTVAKMSGYDPRVLCSICVDDQ